jgi:hypothetical protein
MKAIVPISSLVNWKGHAPQLPAQSSTPQVTTASATATDPGAPRAAELQHAAWRVDLSVHGSECPLRASGFPVCLPKTTGLTSAKIDYKGGAL